MYDFLATAIPPNTRKAPSVVDVAAAVPSMTNVPVSKFPVFVMVVVANDVACKPAAYMSPPQPIPPPTCNAPDVCVDDAVLLCIVTFEVDFSMVMAAVGVASVL